MNFLSSVGPRPRELTGAVDLVAHYGLQEFHTNFCGKPIPVAIADTSYLPNVVGHTELRRGDGAELGQLISGPGRSSNPPVMFRPLDLKLLQSAFTLKENGPIELSEADKGVATISGNKEEKEKKHKKKHRKHKHKHRDKDKDKKKSKDRAKGENGEDHSKKDKDKVKGENGEHRSKKDKDQVNGENGKDQSKKHRKKGDKEEGRHKKRKHNHSSKVEVPGVMKNGN